MEQTPIPIPIKARRGQALAEFALTLPILLVLIFSIVEFGRLFQAWVTIQNAARAAARYASIGAVNYTIFEPNYDLPENKTPGGENQPLDIAVQNTIVPCKLGDERGAKAVKIVDPDTGTGTEIYQGGNESLFATWFDGTDCDPSNEDHQQYRKDILRLFSIMYEGRMASTSLLVEANRFEKLDAADVQQILFDTWSVPRSGNHESRGYFDVMICSSRGFIDSASTSATAGFGSRFITVRNSVDLAEVAGVVRYPGYAFPFCMLNEVPPQNMPTGEPRTDILNNAGLRWLDPGDPGDRVTISITFNHPLVTPLAEVSYITMEARRSIVVESFRAPRAIGAFQRSLPPSDDEDSQRPPTSTPEPTLTATNTNTLTPTNTVTNTPTEEPFDCNKITAIWAESPFVSNQFFMLIVNDNKQSTELTFSSLGWNPLADFKGMYVQSMALDSTVYWAGKAAPAAQQPLTYVDTRNTAYGTFYEGGYRFIPANTSTLWRGTFVNGPTNLAAYYQLWDFEATFEFTNAAAVCTITLQKPERPEPTEPPVPTPGPSPTKTPNCASIQDLRVRFGGFQTQGVVYFEVINNTTRPTSFINFRLIWPDPDHPEIKVAAGAYYLARVTVGGDGPTDDFTIPVWEALKDANGNFTTDKTGNKKTTLPFDIATNSANTAEGRWIQDAIINPGTTRIYLDFEGAGLIGTMFDQFKHRPWHYDDSVLGIGCRVSGGGGGGGGGTDGNIGLDEGSPTKTNTKAPTATKGPTLTPSKTPKPGSPTPKPSPQPTKVPTETKVATKTPSRTPIGQPTPPPSGGGE